MWKFNRAQHWKSNLGKTKILFQPFRPPRLVPLDMTIRHSENLQQDEPRWATEKYFLALNQDMEVVGKWLKEHSSGILFTLQRECLASLTNCSLLIPATHIENQKSLNAFCYSFFEIIFVVVVEWVAKWLNRKRWGSREVEWVRQKLRASWF